MAASQARKAQGTQEGASGVALGESGPQGIAGRPDRHTGCVWACVVRTGAGETVRAEAGAVMAAEEIADTGDDSPHAKAIRRIVDDSPPLNEDQRERLRLLLGGGDDATEEDSEA